MSARWLEMILILRSQIWVQYNLRLTAIISSTTSTSSSSNVITEFEKPHTAHSPNSQL